MTRDDLLRNSKVARICEEEGIVYLALFGSFARGEQTEKSDIDLLVRFKGKKSLFKLVGVAARLSRAFGRPVDLLTEKAVSPYMIDDIRKDLVELYAA